MGINWQQLATPPEVTGSEQWDRMVCAQVDWDFGNIDYSEFLCNLDEIFECLEDL